MTPEQFAALEKLFHEAMELAAAERATFVASIRDARGPELADKLEALLASESTKPMPLAEPSRAKGSAYREGDIVSERFRIIRLLGRGGMGEVYEADDSELGKRVALKTIREEARGSQALKRFKQEVELAQMISSPYVCRIHEFFPLPAERSRPAIGFLTMELLEGTTLAERIEARGPMSWREARSIALQMCLGLEAIHAVAVVHRDFKSRNVMLAPHGGEIRVVVMDLGLAQYLKSREAPDKRRDAFTVVGNVVGTPQNMAPEQFEGGAVSPATDIYAFGVVLYEMVTGKLPFEA